MNIERKTTNTVPELNQLSRLAKVIRETHRTASELAESTKKKQQEAIGQALLCGQALNEAKAIVPHGQFATWIADNFNRKISRQTASRYMRLANVSHASILDGVDSLRQLYLATGLDTPRKPAVPRLEPRSETTTTAPIDDAPAEPAIDIETVTVQDGADPAAMVRSLVEALMGEVHRLGNGMIGGIVIELQPVLDWSTQHNLV